MWMPILEQKSGSVSSRLLAALREDIETGRLSPGDKLPPHRDLAHRLGIGIGTVTTVYGEAARQGLLTASVGRGSFVADSAAGQVHDGTIRLSHNIPTLGFAQRRIAQTLSKLRNRADLLDCLEYAPPAGHERHRRLGATWIRRTSGLTDARHDRLIVTTGAQQAMTLAFDTLCRPGDTIMTEAATYFGIKSIADVGGYKLSGLAMDREGILPEDLDRAAARGARVLYTLPTLQNPTGRTMGPTRRQQIAKIARDRNIWIVEDDLYSAYAPSTAPAPLAALIPDRCFYISGTSKSLAPGLRAGYVIAPDDDMLEAMLGLIRARIYAPATMGAMIASQWIEDGTADEIVAELLAEIAARHALAAEILGDAMEISSSPQCPHIWLPMAELEAERVTARALRAGVELTPPSAPVVDPLSISGIRLCLGGVAQRATLQKALQIIAGALNGRLSDRDAAVV